MNAFKKINNKIHRDGFLSFLLAAVLYPLGYKRRLAYIEMLKRDNIRDRFNLIYKNNLWGSTESGSGKGSEIFYTKNLRDWLRIAIPKYSIATVVDAPCGDFNWMRLVTSEHTFNYIGLDIVDHVIAKNRDNHESQTVKFDIADICIDVIPDCDLLIVRDCLFHLSYSDINRFLINISKVQYKYLLTTTHTVSVKFENYDIQTGDFRLINLFRPPFCFSPYGAMEFVQDHPNNDSTPRNMVLIAKKDVPTALSIF